MHGGRVRLRPVEEADLPRFVEWLADPEVTRWLAAVDEPPTLEDEYEWWRERRADPDNVMWAIEAEDGELIGTVDLRLVPHAPRAELGIAIQDKARWGKGYGTETVRLAVGYAFVELGLHRVELHVDEENARAIRCYEKVGFVREGLLREHRVVEGRFSNTVVMAILAREWDAL